MNYKLPDDYEIKPELKAKLDKLFEFHHMSEDEAQAFIDLHVELTEDFAARVMFAVTKDSKPTATKKVDYLPEGTIPDMTNVPVNPTKTKKEKQNGKFQNN